LCTPLTLSGIDSRRIQSPADDSISSCLNAPDVAYTDCSAPEINCTPPYVYALHARTHAYIER